MADAHSDDGRTGAVMPDVVEPMLARLSTLPNDPSRWAFEVKWDGVRAVARCDADGIRFTTRNGNDVSAAYPELAALHAALGARPAMLDGEIVAFDDRGRPSFQALQSRMHVRDEAAVRRLAQTTPVAYVIFDLLWLDGRPLLDLPYEQRRARLDELELAGPHWQVPDYHAGAGEALLVATREQGLEGIVAKRLDSRYAPGRRDGAWRKIKHAQRQELVIGGWTAGRGGRGGRIGALELGVYDDAGALRYAGRVGTGFTEEELARLARQLSPLAREDSPFVGRQPRRGAHFVEPRLVCEVEFGEWTAQGLLRHPTYRGLREDKAAVTVVRERVAPASDVPDLDALLASGREVRDGVEVEVEGRSLKLSNLDKVLYPATGFAKRDVLAYYAGIAPALLGHLRDRPLTLKRYPDGVDGKSFYEKQCPRHRPDWVQTTSIWSSHGRREVAYCLAQDLPTLLWLANLAALELHPSLSRADAIDRPTTLAFDLDPGAPATVVECCAVALELRELFAGLGLRAFAKTSGSKGMQVYVPLNDPAARYERTKPFARAVADLLEQRHPDLVVAGMAKARRTGRVFIDWSQNDEHKTTVSVYSLRARERPTVSTPVGWDEVEACAAAGDPERLAIDAPEALRRFAARGDVFAEVVALSQRLPDLGGGLADGGAG